MATTNAVLQCPPIERTGITILCGDLQSTVDIVLVHGLNGNPVTTWKHETTGFYWPWELRNSVKDARVMVFGYDTDIIPKFETNFIRIPDIARKLLNELSENRIEDEEICRPLIFIGHSLGGLVIKKALALASHELNFKAIDGYQIYKSTKAIFFFGTPHTGSTAGQKKHIHILKMISRATLTRVPPSVESALKINSGELYDLADEFRTLSLWTEKRLTIFTYFETMSDARVGALVVDKNSAKIGYDEEVLESIEKTHSTMVQCRNAKDQPLKGVGPKIKRLIKRSAESS